MTYTLNEKDEDFEFHLLEKAKPRKNSESKLEYSCEICKSLKESKFRVSDRPRYYDDLFSEIGHMGFFTSLEEASIELMLRGYSLEELSRNEFNSKILKNAWLICKHES